MRCASVVANALAPFSSYSIFAQTQCRRIVSSLNSSSSSSSSSSSFLEETVPRGTLKRVPRDSTEKISELLETFGYTEFAQVNDDAFKGTDQEEEIFYSRDSKGNEWERKKQWLFNNVQLYFSKDVLMSDAKKAVKQLESEL